jgi:hypothetical protein
VILPMTYQLEHYMLHSFHRANGLASSQQKESSDEFQTQTPASMNQMDKYIVHLDAL